MPLPKQYHTSKDYWNLPEGQRAELIDGTLYDMAPPSYRHQFLIAKLSFRRLLTRIPKSGYNPALTGLWNGKMIGAASSA